MMKLEILLIVTLPLCLGQFSIQGPSDGNRVSQGLKYSEEKGIEYTDQRASLGSGDFNIQGATDGNTDFRIQGASDGNSDFQIQGATDGNSQFQIQGATDGNSQFQIQGATDGNADFRIQGATDGHGQSAIQGPYNANQGGGRALQYNDPSGLRVNWRSYQRQVQPRQHAQRQQPEPQYAAETAAPVPVRVAQEPAQPVHQPQTQVPPQQPISYRPYTNAPSQIKQILQFQAQIPYLNIIPEQYRYDELAAAQANSQQVQAHYREQAQQARAPEPTNEQYKRPQGRPRGSPRHKRQAPQHQQAAPQQQYTRISQPPVEPQPHYSSNVPSQIQQLLNYQSQLPYNIIANQIVYRPDKPYVPQPVKPSAPANAQYQSQGQRPYNQGQGGVRPVTENQY